MASFYRKVSITSVSPPLGGNHYRVKIVVERDGVQEPQVQKTFSTFGEAVAYLTSLDIQETAERSDG